jgi:GMP synthase (glutamine-hydrolysing)
MTERVLILDFGSQYTQLIARRVREHRVYCEIHPCTVGDLFVTSFAPAVIVPSGGPASTHEAESPRAPPAVFELGVPVLGVCYGEQTMCAQLGGRVEPSSHREYGRAEIRLDRPSPLFEGILAPGQSSTVWMSHGDRIAGVPRGFSPVARSDTSPFAAIADEDRRFYGLQFHP